MDIINHATQGFLLSYYLFYFLPEKIRLIISIIYGIIGTLPDVIGDIYAKYDNYKMYDRLHNLKITIKNFILFTFFLHTYQDKFLHGEGKRWWILKERMWYEILTWILNILILFYYI